MATKPANTTPEFASLLNYTKGPKVGQPTKSNDVAFLVSEGHIPGKQFPTAANEFNKWLNLSSIITGWVFLGSSAKVTEALIVETDANGKINATAIDVGGTASGGIAGVFASNASGEAIKVLANEGIGIRIDSNNSTTGSPESLKITNTRMNFDASMIDAKTDGGPDSLGGSRLNVNASLLLSTNNITHRRLSALNALNGQGTAVEAISAGQYPAITALNLSAGRTSIRAGFGNEDISPSNLGGIGIECRGGDGDPSVGLEGLYGIEATGGDAKDGSVNVMGGAAIHARGGLSATMQGGPALFAQSFAAIGNAIVVEHKSSINSSDLAVFRTGDNNANGIVVDHEGFGDGQQIDAQGGNGLKITMTQETGGQIGPALALRPQNAPNVQADGDVWSPNASGSGSNHLQYRSSGLDTYVQRTVNPWCAGSTYINGGQIVNSDTFVDIGTLSFNAAQRPVDTGTVLIRASGGIQNDATDNSQVSLRFTDETAAPGVSIKAVQFQLDLTPGGGLGNPRPAQLFFEYTLPAAGPRTFKLQFNLPNGTNATQNIAQNWLFEVVAAP